MLDHQPSQSAGDATVRIDPDRRGPRVDETLFGKFGEHLYRTRNAKNAFEAQVLHNPTFGAWKFQVRDFEVDGGRPAVHDPDTKAERIEEYADYRDYPGADRLTEAYQSGTALWWFACGPDSAVTTSPDVGTADDRAQRVETDAAGAGLAQWCHLPLHRTRGYEGQVTFRAKTETSVTLAVNEVADDGGLGATLAETTLSADEAFRTVSFELELPERAAGDPEALYAVSVTPDEAANLVLDRVLLYPDDHVNRADPELIEFLADADLPLFRWPGGNFVSGYRWRDGVGPIKERPTKPNPAWDGLETNLFGTAEYVSLCETVGCEPMICLNAGDGTAAEAAAWVEYCNGDSEETEMGALRADHGHPEPFDVTYWEVGNEVYGPWQVSWTTADGYADRFQRFEAAMTAVDDDIEVLACGNRQTDWNDPLLDTAADGIDWLTDHVLVGSAVGPDVDAAELFNGYMALAGQVTAEYEALADDMAAAGVTDPKIAITELQLFSYPGDDRVDPVPTNTSVSEACYAATFVHESIRSDAVRMITHSGTGNHAAGLAKDRERVRAHPAFYYHAMAVAMAGGTPLGVDLACATYDTDTAFNTDSSELFGEVEPASGVPVLDPVAVATDDGLVVEVIHRDATREAVDMTVVVPDEYAGAETATVTTVTGETMADENTFADPEAVTPEQRTVQVTDGTVELSIPPLSVVSVRFDGE